MRRRFSEAARDGLLWTLTPESSRAFWLGVYEQMLRSLDLPSADGLRDTLYEGFTDLGNYALFDDVAETLDALAATGVTLGIVSNFEAWLDDLLAALGVRERFPVRVISGIDGMEKPDPRIYELALARAGATAERGRVRRRQPGVRHRPARRARHVPGADRSARAPSAARRRTDHRPAGAARRAGGRVSGELYDRERAEAALPMLREMLPRIREARRALDRRERAHHRGGRGRRRRGRRAATGSPRRSACAPTSPRSPTTGILLRDPETGSSTSRPNATGCGCSCAGSSARRPWRTSTGSTPATRIGSRGERGRASGGRGARRVGRRPAPRHRGRRGRRRPAVRARPRGRRRACCREADAVFWWGADGVVAAGGLGAGDAACGGSSRPRPGSMRCSSRNSSTSDVVVTNARGVFDEPIAEWVIGSMLAFATGLHASILDQQRREWTSGRTTERLAGRAARGGRPRPDRPRHRLASPGARHVGRARGA